MRRSKLSRLSGFLLALCMVVGLLPTAMAADLPEPTVNSEGMATQEYPDQGMTLAKSATLEKDGTYTIRLEANSTGKIEQVETVTPSDVVLVLDVSGSMNWAMDKTDSSKYTPVYNVSQSGIYYYKNNNGKYYPLHYSYNNWLSAEENNKIVKRSQTQFYSYSGASRLQALKNAANGFVDSIADQNASLSETNKHRVGIVTFSAAASQRQALSDADTNRTALKNTIRRLTASGATRADLGMSEARTLLNNTPANRKKIVVFFTDGQPTSKSAFEDSVANATIVNARNLKQGVNGADIYSIAIFDDADIRDTSNKFNAYMHGVSSNYKNASAYNYLLARTEGTETEETSYYKVATNASQLNAIFKSISDQVNSNAKLGEKSVVRDIMSSQFKLPDNYDKTKMTIETVAYTGNGSWASSTTKINPNATVTFSDGTTAKYADVSDDGRTIDVRGFDFTKEFVHEASGSKPAGGKKLIITIPGVIPDDENFVSGEVYTNNIDSGVYANDDAAEPSVRFPRPTVNLKIENFVLDYAKETFLKTIKNGEEDYIVSKITPENVESRLKKVSGKFGDAELKSLSGNADKQLYYTPKTMNWSGADSFYAFKYTNDKIENWSQVNVIPANNVYYEDSFVTDEKTGTVGIEYTGDFTVDGTASGNTEEANNSVHGWIASKDDDTTYSDGSAHKMTANGTQTTASFEFTGTGVDIYSKTDLKTGTVFAKLTGKDDDGTAVTKRLIVDNLSENGDYYQAPTLWFKGLKHGTYKVTLTVTTQAEGRYTYYLDGIRVYNPLGTVTADQSAAGVAYGRDNELNAVFTSVRDILVDQNGLSSKDDEIGAAYIDEVNGDLGTNTEELGVYEQYGPKNEVYLSNGKMIAFKTKSVEGNHYYIGLSATKDGATTALINSQTVNVNSASDQYFEITPTNDGYVVIKNTGSNLLAVTNLRTTNANTQNDGIQKAPASTLVHFARAFFTASESGEGETIVVDDPTAEVPTDPSVGEEVTPTVDDGTNTGEVVIDNPIQSGIDPSKQNKNWLRNIFSTIQNWLKRGR